MPSFREFFVGPWRAVAVLGVTQILAWGTVFYPPVMTVPLIAAVRGFSFTFAMGGFSAGLLAAGFFAPAGRGVLDPFCGEPPVAVRPPSRAGRGLGGPFSRPPAPPFSALGPLSGRQCDPPFC